MTYITMAAMYPTMTSGKVEEFLVNIGDTVKDGTPVAEIVAEGYYTLLSEHYGVIKEIYVGEGEYIEVDTPIMEVEEIELAEGESIPRESNREGKK
ncbi:MAG: biotin/lipoyl-containing protein [Nitrospinaceae bacterium]